MQTFGTSIGAWLAGCALAWPMWCSAGGKAESKPADSPPTVADVGDVASELAARSKREFQRGRFLKPESGAVEEGLVDLAPLLLEELGTDGNGSPCGPGTVRIGPGGEVSVDCEHPTVYFASGTAVVGGVELRQWVFHWWYEGGERDGPVWRWLRMTLDDRGYPLVWEVLEAGQPYVAIYVSKPLEEKAAKRWGPPPAGRLFSVERPAAERADAIVVRVLDAGPVPMGPTVYCDAGRREITTLLCRCMPSQVKEVAETGYYALRPATAVPGVDVSRETLFLPLRPGDLPGPAEAMASPYWLEQVLRLPDAP